MFYRHTGEYYTLARFSDWSRYRENEADIQVKDILENLGIESLQWETVAYVGKTGLFYDFSPRVQAEICERRQARKAKKAEVMPVTSGDVPEISS